MNLATSRFLLRCRARAINPPSCMRAHAPPPPNLNMSSNKDIALYLGTGEHTTLNANIGKHVFKILTGVIFWLHSFRANISPQSMRVREVCLYVAQHSTNMCLPIEQESRNLHRDPMRCPELLIPHAHQGNRTGPSIYRLFVSLQISAGSLGFGFSYC